MEANDTCAKSIRKEITRFQSVHPHIYSIYDLLDDVKDDQIASAIRHHLVLIEDSFVKSQEWSLARSVREIRIGVIGCNAKAALVHWYLTGSYLQQIEEDSDSEAVDTGGRFKKLLHLNGGDYLVLVRQDGSSEPDQEFLDWIDGLIIVASSKVHCPYGTLAQSVKQPICFVNIDTSIKFHNIKHDLYFEVDVSTGTGIENAFTQLARLVLESASHSSNNALTPCPPTPSQAIGPLWTPTSYPLGGLTPTSVRKSGRRRSNLFSSKSNNYKVTSGRTIPSKQGQMWKKSNSKWKKKYVILTGEHLIYYTSLQEYMAIDANEASTGKAIQLAKTSIKATTTLKKSESLPRQGMSSLSLQNFRHKDKHDKHDKDKDKNGHSNTPINNNNNANGNTPSGNNSGGQSDMYGFTITNMDNKLWEFEVGDNREERDDWVQQIEQIIRTSLQGNLSTKMNIVDASVVKNLNLIPGNEICADCSAKAPDWASINFGIMICIGCSGIHRNLGTHHSRVRSIDLDEWNNSWISVMTKIGNALSNSIYEENLPPSIKPTPNSSTDLKTEFIQNKYKHKKFINLEKFITQNHQNHSVNDVFDLINVLARRTQTKEELSKLMDFFVKQNNLAAVQLLLWNNALAPKDIPNGTDPDIKELLINS